MCIIYNSTYIEEECIYEDYEISKLDINRIYRYIEKYIKENASGTADKEIEEEGDDDDCECADE